MNLTDSTVDPTAASLFDLAEHRFHDLISESTNRGTRTVARHLSTVELEAGLEYIRAAPTDGGRLDGIIVRPEHNARLDVASCAISGVGGLAGDHWAKGCWKNTEDGLPDPDVQVCIMGARTIALMAGTRENWPPAGDNLFIDMDLSSENLPAGTRLTIGSALLEITSVPHNGCAKFIARYGRDACTFVNSPLGKALRLRGVYARVLRDGVLTVGDTVAKAE
jgi:hypothetical protein